MSFEQGRAIVRDGLVVGTNGRISVEAVDTFGTADYALSIVGGFLFAELDFRSLNRYRRLFTPTSTGVDLEKLGNDNHDTPVRGASASLVVLSLERVDVVLPITVDALTTCTTPDGTKFRTDEDLTFAALDPGPKTINATSVLFGSDQNAEPGTISAFDASPPQADMMVTNAARAAGGNDRESDAEYRARIAARYTTASKGIKAAIELAALSVPQVRTATAYEILGSDGYAVGGGELYVADKLGYSNQAMIDAVLAAMPDAMALGAWIDVFGASPVEESIAAAVTWETGKATPFNRRLAKQAVVAIVNTLQARAQIADDLVPDEATLSPGLIETAIRGIIGVKGVDVTLPVGDVIPPQGGVIRTTLGLVTIS